MGGWYASARSLVSEIFKAFPLQWPTGWKRTPASERRHGQFGKVKFQEGSAPGTGWQSKGDLSVWDAVERVRAELRRMRIHDDNIVISTNLKLRLDGMPRSDQAQPADSGVAVYWLDNTVDGWPRRCMAVDAYVRVEHNLAALAAVLEAMRAIERHGGPAILDRAFTGFAALPPPVAAARPWREVLAVGDTRDSMAVRDAYRVARWRAHPDKGGSEEAFHAVDRAYEQAARELGFQP